MKITRINEKIPAYRVILIAQDGTNRGEILKTAALDIARQEGLDLVEVGDGPVPVCKLMDYGRSNTKNKKPRSIKIMPYTERNTFCL